MRKSILKRVSAVACAVVLTVASTTACFASGEWEEYWGKNTWDGEGGPGCVGQLTKNEDDSWEAYYETIGWGGVWGGQVKRPVDLKAGTEYTLKFDVASSDCDKWMFIKVTNDDTSSGDTPILFGKWVKATVGSTVHVEETFTTDADATMIFFGIGGEKGDRTEEAALYEYASETPDDGDPLGFTTLTVTNYSLAAAEAETTEAAEETIAEEETEAQASGNAEETTAASDVKSENETPATTAAVVTKPVQTGDFKPIACAAVAVLAASSIVVLTRKREEA